MLAMRWGHVGVEHGLSVSVLITVSGATVLNLRTPNLQKYAAVPRRART